MNINTELLVRILDKNKDLITKSTPKDHWPNFGEDHILGCGEYGCVFDTKSKDIVFKLTTDRNEFKFVVAAMNISEWPEGMIQYYQVMRLQATQLDSAFTRIKFYGLWRENAKDVGNLSDTEVDPEFIKVLDNCWNIARDIRHIIYDVDRIDDLFSSKIDIEVKQQIIDGEIEIDDWIENKVESYIGWTKYINSDEFNSVLHAMRWYAQLGILLGDVHLGNLGQVKRKENGNKYIWVITDPGEAVFVDNRYNKLFNKYGL